MHVFEHTNLETVPWGCWIAPLGSVKATENLNFITNEFCNSDTTVIFSSIDTKP